ncbi:MAG: hypothetical protein ACTHOF_12690 [Flavisolibacter sp.]
MKYILILLFVIPTLCFSQEKATTESGKTVLLNKNGTWKYITAGKSNFIKKESTDKESYILSGTVKIETGKGDNVDVFFNGIILKGLWDEFLKRHSSEYEFFSLVANMLSLEAKYTLKNNLSFEPMTRQFFMYQDNSFICDYKMMGRNGYGNLVETSALVKYNPEKRTSSITE